MSTLAGHPSQLAGRYVSKRLRAAERSRRADEGTVTEMARLLAREAGERPAAVRRQDAVRLASVESAQSAARAAEAA